MFANLPDDKLCGTEAQIYVRRTAPLLRCLWGLCVLEEIRLKQIVLKLMWANKGMILSVIKWLC